MGRLLLQCRDPEARRRVDQEYRLPILHEWCGNGTELIVRTRGVDVLGLVVDTADEDGRSTAPAASQIRRQRPRLPILLWCRREEAAGRAFQELCRVGVTGVLFREPGEQEERALAQLVPRGTLKYHDWIEALLERRVPSSLRAVVGSALHPVNAQLTVPELAQHLGMPRRTLSQHLSSANFPSAQVLLEWNRVLGAVWDLESRSESVERIAHDHGFSSAGALRTVLNRWANDVPKDLRGSESFGWVLRCFDRRLKRCKPAQTL